MSEDDIGIMLSHLWCCLKPRGYLFMWVDKYHVAEGTFKQDNFPIVDLITWGKLTGTGKMQIGMGYRSRRSCEYLLVKQKPPKGVGLWSDRSIRDMWHEAPSSDFPHAKPLELTRRLIQAVTSPGDFVLDPCAGSYTTLRACRLANRQFIGGDLLAHKGAFV
jgi:site-specific DNA-methyltransferase (adenine-specific)